MAETEGLVAQPNKAVPVASGSVLDELRRIQAICNTMHAVAQVLEVQLMESLWKISTEVSERPAFERLVGEHTNLPPDRAWLMAQTWEVARRNRDLRRLALNRPSEALALVEGLIENNLAEGAENLTDVDREMAKFAAMPQRKKVAAIRELIADGQAAREKRHPADQERIRELEAERDAAVVEMGKARKVLPHPGGEIRQALDDLRAAESRLAEVAERLDVVLTAASGASRTEAIQITHLIQDAAARIEATAVQGWDEE